MRYAIAATAFLSMITAGPASAGCGAKLTAVKDAAARGDLVVLERAAVAKPAESCTADDEFAIRALFAEALFRAGEAAKSDADTAFQLIQKAAGQQGFWRANRAYGKLLLARHDYRGASEAYGDTMALIDRLEPADALFPKENELEAIVSEANSARMLAAGAPNGSLPEFGKSRLTNGVSALYAPFASRDAGPIKIPVPILFEYNSSKMTPDGRKAADELVALFKSIQPQGVSIVGHTDQVGGDEFNLKLSRERAAAIEAYLKAEGVTAQIKTDGKGKSSPLKVAEGISPTQAERDQMNRRVEFSWQ